MCVVGIERVRVSREQFVAFGTALGGDCADIRVTLDVRSGSGQSLWAPQMPVDWISTERWRAAFALTPERRETICRGRVIGDPPSPSWSVSASCPECENTAHFSTELECCPSLAIIGADPAMTCEDPDFTGVLSRRVTVRWRVDRRDAGGAIVSRASIETPDRILFGEDRRLAEDTAMDVFADDSFLVPSGVALRARVAIVGDDGGCAESFATFDIAALPACACDGQPHSTARFTVIDARGQDVTQAVLDGRCIDSASATVRAPSDAGNARFEWVAPATPESSDPFATRIAIPDTDEGVTVSARFGSAPCVQERSLVLKRCQARPDFCARLPFSCDQIGMMWLVVFYFASFSGYVGLGLMSAGATSVVTDVAMALLSEAIAALSGVIPEPVVTKLLALIAKASSSAAATSATAASFAVAIGGGMTLAAVLGYLVWLGLMLLWFACCAPRSQCRFVRSMVWLLAWIGFTIPLWALLLGVVSVIFQLKFMTLAGIGIASVFGYLFTSVFAGVFALAAKWADCAMPNPIGLPPLLEDSP
jgi:hypothetical protein